MIHKETAMPKTGDPLALPKANPQLAAFLETRRSNLAKGMSGPGPTSEQIEQLLTTAMRVPDHLSLIHI